MMLFRVFLSKNEQFLPLNCAEKTPQKRGKKLPFFVKFDVYGIESQVNVLNLRAFLGVSRKIWAWKSATRG
jgi:hypothetical protein